MKRQPLLLLRHPYAILAAGVLLLVLVGCGSETPVAPTAEVAETVPAQDDAMESPLSPTTAPAVATVASINSVRVAIFAFTSIWLLSATSSYES